MNLNMEEIAYLMADGIALIGGIIVGLMLLSGHRLRNERYGLRFILATSAILGLRILQAFAPHWILVFLIYIVIASLPILSLMMAESLMRRHAPKWLKAAILVASGLLLLLSIVPHETVRPFLAGFVLSGSLLIILFFVASRDRKSLLPIENERLSTLTLGFVFLIPLATTDFFVSNQSGFWRLGAVGILCMLLALIRGMGGISSVTGYLLDLCAACLIAAAFLIITLVFNDNGEILSTGYVPVSISLSLLVICTARLRSIIIGKAQASLSIHLANARLDSLKSFLTDLRGHKMMKASRFLEGNELKEKAAPEMLALLDESPLQSRATLERTQTTSTLTRSEEATLSFLNAHEMTHAISLRKSPPALLLCEGLGASGDKIETANLILLSRLARQIEEAD